MSTDVKLPPLFLAARLLFEAQTERPPSENELGTFCLEGDFARAIGDPVTFARLEGQALKAGRTADAATWRGIAEDVAKDDLDATIFGRVLNAAAMQADSDPQLATQLTTGDTMTSTATQRRVL